MILADEPPLPEWDYQWWGANEKVAPRGWTKTTSGTTNTAMVSGYWRIDVSTNGGYVQYSWPQTFTKGVIQTHFRFSSYNGNYRLYLSNGTNAIGVRATYGNATGSLKNLLLNNADLDADMTSLTSFSRNTSYKLKLVLDNGYADVYWGAISGNLTLVASHVDISTITNSSPLNMTTLRFTSSAADGNVTYWYLYAILMKFNRTE